MKAWTIWCGDYPRTVSWLLFITTLHLFHATGCA